MDNGPTVALLEARPVGLLALLDEECTLGKGTDATFLSKAAAAFKASPAFVFSRLRPADFGVKHYAGTVSYSSPGFLEKNKDQVRARVLVRACVHRLPAGRRALLVAPRPVRSRRRGRSVADVVVRACRALAPTWSFGC